MLLLAPIVFVGIVGSHHDAVEHQLEPSLEKNGITEMAIPDADRAALIKHTAAAKRVVKRLHAGGVIAGQLTGKGAARSFRLVIYDADGNLTTDLESPIAATGLTKKNIQAFEINISDIVASQPHDPKKSAPVAVAAAPAPAPSPSGDDEAAGATPAVAAQAPAASQGEHGVHVRLGLLVGIVSRNFATDPNTVPVYSSSPVGTGGIEGAVSVGERMRIGASFEHTLVMHTDVAGGSASTAIGRAEATVAYDVVRSSVQLAPILGVGTRYFSVDSTSTNRSPDLEYQYVLLGATIGKPVGSRWLVRGTVAFEPVVGGLHPAMLPDPARWGFDVGAALELRATPHVFARAAFDYQSFSSSWSMTGNATDGYPSGTIAVGAAL